MNLARWLGSLLLFTLGVSDAAAALLPLRDKAAQANRHLCGTLVAYTHHHGVDQRIWSPALCQHRDLLVYLPPGFDPGKQYPAMLWLHGFLQDEESFANTYVHVFDEAIACGKLPPMIIAAPDGTARGHPGILAPNSFFINSDLGNFEDYLICDVWGFVLANYPVRPEREAHVLAGVSMGGFAAFNEALKHSDQFKVAAGIYPPLNLRWLDCHGRYFGNFDPDCWAWREEVRRWDVVGRFAGGTIKVRVRRLINPLFDRAPDTIERLSRENPAEMLERLGIVNGQLDMFVAYGARDGFNIDAQVESFIYFAQQRGICVNYCRDAHGHHNMRTAMRLIPNMIDWLGRTLEPYRVPCEEVHLPAPTPVP